MITVMVVPVEGPVRIENIEPDLPTLQRLVGGYIEGISGEGWTAYCNEEGKIHGLHYNERATTLANSFGWITNDVLVGDVVFCGPPDKDGRETDVPRSVVGAAQMQQRGRTVK